MSLLKLTQIVEPALEDIGYLLVRLNFSRQDENSNRQKRSKLQIMAEPVDLSEMTIKDCEKISRHIATVLDVEDPIKVPYYLEVSSPGIDRPLTRIADFDRFKGELVKVRMRFTRDGRKRFRAKIAKVDENENIIFETGFGRITLGLGEIESVCIDPSKYFSTKSRL